MLFSVRTTSLKTKQKKYICIHKILSRQLRKKLMNDEEC